MIKQERSQQGWRIKMLLLHGAMVTAPIALLLAPSCLPVNLIGKCISKSLLGFNCPACGITHSAMAMFGGHIKEAFLIHPAGPVITVIVGLMTLYFASVIFTNYKGFEWTKEAKTYTMLERLAVGVLVAGWVGKLFMN